MISMHCAKHRRFILQVHRLPNTENRLWKVSITCLLGWQRAASETLQVKSNRPLWDSHLSSTQCQAATCPLGPPPFQSGSMTVSNRSVLGQWAVEKASPLSSTHSTCDTADRSTTESPAPPPPRPPVNNSERHICSAALLNVTVAAICCLLCVHCPATSPHSQLFVNAQRRILRSCDGGWVGGREGGDTS
ncbi:unnamed protein product [Mesocestoides corti]|uniref:Uncharacterized protein n=1 Tax=Mesocestoides corti TaxID=53468 RepID=A0A0R3U6L6_MESCO|nr:unnamed protein product [Mesocestoides corti]